MRPLQRNAVIVKYIVCRDTHEKNNVLLKCLNFRWTDFALALPQYHDCVGVVQAQSYCGKSLITHEMDLFKISVF